jgi:hypothetical protein
MSREYPRVVESMLNKKWAKIGKGKGPKCCVCGELATHETWVQVNWFRGDDEGKFKACKLHKDDAQALLNTQTIGAPS